MTDSTYAIVIPTLGRPSLRRLLESLAEADGPPPFQIVVVVDRQGPINLPPLPDRLANVVTHRVSGGRGPAAARNVGWHAVDRSCTWVVFVDDDVVMGPRWLQCLADDLDQPPDVAGVQGRISVPLPNGRRPTDWERGTHGLETAAWITADMAYRRDVLVRVGGFDERFPRAFREDADLALRVQRSGGRLVRGTRQTIHPVRPTVRWISVQAQAGNADDALMRRLHGGRWRQLAYAPRGYRGWHVLTTAAAGTALIAPIVRRRRLGVVGAATWLIGTARFAWGRIGPGPRTPDEIITMVLTSVLIPPTATWHWIRGAWRHRNARPWQPWPTPRAVLFDRDGTLIHDVPYNCDPSKVRPVDGAVELVAELRERGLRTGVITNQSGVGRGWFTAEEAGRVNARVDELFGGFDVWAVCPHIEADACACRKPAPGMVLEAAQRLGFRPREIVVIGDIGADVQAAESAGARGVLVPTPRTRPQEIAAARHVADNLADAVRMVVGTDR